MSEETPEVFRGHVEECLKHFAKRLSLEVPKFRKNAPQTRESLASFCGAKNDTVRRWLHGTGGLPVGESYLRLMCFLDMMGYRVIELERTPKAIRNFLELIGFGLISSTEAKELLGYGSASTMYKVLQGEGGTSDGKEQKMWDLWKERREALETRKENARREYQKDIPVEVEAMREAKKLIVTRPQAPTIHLMKGLLDLLDDECCERLCTNGSSESTESVQTVLRLSARLSNLSSRLMSQQLKEGDGL